MRMLQPESWNSSMSGQAYARRLSYPVEMQQFKFIAQENTRHPPSLVKARKLPSHFS